MQGSEPEISVSLTPKGPLALIYVGAFYSSGRYFGALTAWLLERFGIARRLGIPMNKREIHEELEVRFGLLSGSVYLAFWIITMLGIGPIP